MKVYIAHNFLAREWLPEVVQKLNAVGISCTSTWIFDDAHARGGTMRDSAFVDLKDIQRSDAIAMFVDNFGPRPGKGKYFELGYAYALGIRTIIVGEDEGCVFYDLPAMERVKDVEGLLEALTK